MMRSLVCLLAALCLSLAAGPRAVAQIQVVGDLASPQMLDGRHLIITVAITSQEEAARRMDALATRHPISAVTVWPLSTIALHCLVVRVADGATLTDTVAALQAEADVRWVQPVNDFSVSATYSDEHFSRQHALSAMNVSRAHQIATGDAVRIALIDTGVDTTHPDLAERITFARDFVNDGLGAVGEDHGTAMAGVLAADAHNGEGIVGVAPGADILSFRACWEAGRRGLCTTFSLARALNVAIVQDVSIINLSLGGPEDPLLRALIEHALGAGITVVSAADGPAFPARMDGVIAVAGNGGVAAPADDVLTTLPGGRYGFRSGSSIAAAHVSGVVALIKQWQPNAGPALIGDTLESATAEFGVVDACRALTAISPQSISQC